ncbi:hypothetical protein U9M48_016235, partial [Paspalum notatum var. saurae]
SSVTDWWDPPVSASVALRTRPPRGRRRAGSTPRPRIEPRPTTPALLFTLTRTRSRAPPPLQSIPTPPPPHLARAPALPLRPLRFPQGLEAHCCLYHLPHRRLLEAHRRVRPRATEDPHRRRLTLPQPHHSVRRLTAQPEGPTAPLSRLASTRSSRGRRAPCAVVAPVHRRCPASTDRPARRRQEDPVARPAPVGLKSGTHAAGATPPSLPCAPANPPDQRKEKGYVLKKQVHRSTPSNGGLKDQLSPKHDWRAHQSCLEGGAVQVLAAFG